MHTHLRPEAGALPVAAVAVAVAILTATLLLTPTTSHAAGLSGAGAKAIAAMNQHFASVATHQAAVLAAVDAKLFTLKPGVDRAAALAAAQALFAGYSKAVQAARGLTPADKKTPEFQQAMKGYYAARQAIVYIGIAAPTAFLSGAGQGSWAAIDQGATRALAYRKDLDGAARSITSERQLHDMELQLQRGIRGLTSLSGADRGSAAGIGMTERLKAADRYIKATRKRWQGDAAVASEVGGKCKQLQTDIYTGRAPSQLDTLRELHQGGKTRMNYHMNPAGTAEWVRAVTEMKALVMRLRPICDAPANKAWLERCKPTHGKTHMQGLYADKDPVVWCEVTRDLPTLVGKWLEQSIARNDAAQGHRYDSASLERQNGYLSDDSLRTWQEMFTLSDARKTAMIKPYLPVFAAAGIEPGNTERFFAGTVKRMDALRAEVERLAPRWERPKSKDSFYGVGQSKTQVKRVYGKVRILAAGANPAWTIKKNALGIPLHRSRGGWILYQVSGERLCQQRGWGVMENWVGRRYVKDNGVSFGRLRFQACGR